MKKRFLSLTALLLCAALLLPILSACSTEKKKIITQKESGFTLTDETYKPSYNNADIPEGLKDVVIKATETNGDNVKCSTGFTLLTSGDVSENEVTGAVTITPFVPMSFTKTANGYNVTPAKALDSGTVYKITVGDPANPYNSFAFQTESIFKITSFYPANQRIGVPIDTGIEISFSEAVAKDNDFNEYISVIPAAEGTFEIYPNGKTIVFIPKKSLDESTIYTVTVKQGLKSANGAVLENGGSAIFTTEEKASLTDTVSFYARFSNSMPIVSPGEDLNVAISYHGYSIVNTIMKSDVLFKDADVTVYKYADSRKAIEAMEQGINKIIRGIPVPFATDGLTKISSGKTAVKDNEYGFKSITFPGMDAGFYLAEVTFNATVGITACSSTVQAFIQVTDCREFHETSGGNLTVWVNTTDLKSVSGTEINIYSAEMSEIFDGKADEMTFAETKVSTDASGIANIGTGSADIILFDIGGRLISSTYSPDYSQPQYICQNYTDREMYFADDVINFSGLIMPINGAMLPDRIYLETSCSLARQRIDVDENGGFKGSYTLEGFNSGYLSMSFTDENGNTLFSDHVRVTKAEKPVYKATLEFDKLYYEFGETAKATLKASFYDGTPAAGIKFRIYGNNFYVGGNSTTDMNGEITLHIKTGAVDRIYSTNPTTIYLRADLIGMESSNLSVSASAVYFQSKNAFAITREDDGIRLTLNKYNPSVIKTEADLSYNVFPQNCIGEAVSGKAAVTLVKYHSEKTPKGSYYDPITKKIVTTYNYYTVDEEISYEKINITTDGVRLDYISDTEDGYWYSYKIQYFDDENGAIDYSVCATEYMHYEGDYSDGLTLKGPDSGKTFSVGDTFGYAVYNGDELLANDVPVLMSVYSNKTGKHTECRTVSSEFDLTCTEEYMFGANGKAVVFCGDSYKVLNMSVPKYNTEDSKLNIKIDTDKEKYKPGETANVTLTVTDRNGNPVSGILSAGVVDEACFALEEQKLNSLGEWFNSLRSYTNTNSVLNPFIYLKIKTGLKTREYYEDLWFWSSYGYVRSEGFYANGKKTEVMDEAVATDAPGEDSSGSETRIREIFADNPVFERIILGTDGKAMLTFTVPDNITEWRISCVAYSGTEAEKPEAVLAGTATSDIICTLPFFINLSMSNSYVTGDDISLSARIAGTAREIKARYTSFSAELSDITGKVLDCKETDRNPGEFAHFDFSTLEPGTYTVTVKAVCGDYSDGIKKTFTVTDDGITVPIRKTADINDIKNLTPKTYPVRVSFYNTAYDEFLTAANVILRRNYDRSDALAARYAVLSVFENLFGENTSDELEAISDRLSGYAERYGLIPLLESGEEDIILSAKIAAIIPECLSDSAKYRLANSFADSINKNIYDTDAEMAACFMGLAALGNPVLNELKTLVGYTLSDEAYIYISAAFALCGDYSSAKQVYDLIKPHIVYGTESYYDAETTEESILMTAETLIAASIIDKENAYSFVRYLQTHTATTDLTSLETAAYIRYFYPIGATEQTLTYKSGENGDTVNLKPGEVFTLSLGKSDLENLTVSGGDGLSARVYYEGSYAEATDNITEAKDISVKKTIEPYNEASGLYKVTISVTGTTDRDYIWFTVTDRIPTGARYYPCHIYDKYNDIHGYISLRNDGSQMMQGYAGAYTPYDHDTLLKGKQSYEFSMTTSYIIRGANAGDFALSPVILINSDDDVYAISEKAAVTITENGAIITK